MIAAAALAQMCLNFDYIITNIAIIDYASKSIDHIISIDTPVNLLMLVLSRHVTVQEQQHGIMLVTFQLQ